MLVETVARESSLRRVRLDDPAALPLIAGLTREFGDTYGDSVTGGEMASREAAEFEPPRGTLLVLEEGGISIAGGGVAPLGPGTAEVKRMWTAPGHRRRGHAAFVLRALECEAAELGYSRLRLVTGARSTAALGLYRSAGYRAIPGFDRYRDEPLARSFEKVLEVRR